MKAMCSDCGERPAKKRGMCQKCYSRWWRKQRRGDPKTHKVRERDARLVSCPEDPVLMTQMYKPGVTSFPRTDFRDTVAEGYFPEGSVWKYKAAHDSRVREWVVRNGALHEVGGRRVIRPKRKG